MNSKEGSIVSARIAAVPIILFLLGSAVSVFPATIHVPADQPTIQAGIEAAGDGDVVLVAPGTYIENVCFFGKAITLRIVNGADVTTINGSQSGQVVTFINYETNQRRKDFFKS